jgi:hypothetical protein
MAEGKKLMDILNDQFDLFLDCHLSKFQTGTPEYKLLEVFSYGTWKDYVALEPSLPANLKLPKEGKAVDKLRSLTLLSLFAEKSTYGLEALRKELALKTDEEVEGLLIPLMASDLLEGKIDEATKSVVCVRASARCVRNSEKDVMQIAENIRKIRSSVKGALNIAVPAGA